MKVLHVYSGNLYGGIEAFLRTVAQHTAAMPATKNDFALCFEGRIANELRDRGGFVQMLGVVRARSPRSVATARQALSALLRRGGYDVVVCHAAWAHAIFAPVVRERRIPLAHFMHDVPNARGWLDRWANLTPPDAVLCNSAFTASSGDWFFRSVPRRVLRLPVAIDEPLQLREARDNVRAQLGASPHTVVILQASRMQAWKGQQLLIEALSMLSRSAEWVCWIAGAAQRPSELAYERDLRTAVARFGLGNRVKFLGQREDVHELMGAADIYCQPNVGPEPFGVAFVEALAAGLPVVSTRMGGALEIVDDTCGRLARPDAGSVAGALAELVENGETRASLSARGPSRARGLCDVESRLRELADTLSSMRTGSSPGAEERASLSMGRSNDAILEVVAAVLRERAEQFDVVVDLGCGRGDASRRLAGAYGTYVGCDLVRYEDFPRAESVQFRQVDLNQAPFPLDDRSADAVVSIETIEHVENPRALVREMARIVRPGGWIVVSTPNQLSLVSKIHLFAKDQFQAFQEAPGLYPAHITALLEVDLRRIAHECGLRDVEIRYSDCGRIPFSVARWPSRAGLRGRWFSDNVVMVGLRP